MAAYTTIDNPELYFQCKLYTGNATDDTAITLDGSENMQPDMVWVKCRSNSGYNHNTYDSARGATKYIRNNSTGAEVTDALTLKSFDSDGFTLGTDATNLEVNDNTKTYVAWCWKGGTTSGITTNGSTTITPSSYSFSSTSGFSILKYTGNSTAGAKLAHGLGGCDAFLIKRTAASGDDWRTYNRNLGGTKNTKLNSDDSSATGTNIFNDTDPDSVNITLGSHNSANASDAMICYAFKSIQGFSKFGTYKGNGNADGTYIHLGLRPAFVMLKRTDAADSWFMYDNKRSPFNVVDDYLIADGSGAEVSTSAVNLDLLSNGFKIRNTDNGHNNSSGTYLYIAFAESPFVNSKGVPNNAR